MRSARQKRIRWSYAGRRLLVLCGKALAENFPLRAHRIGVAHSFSALLASALAAQGRARKPTGKGELQVSFPLERKRIERRGVPFFGFRQAKLQARVGYLTRLTFYHWRHSGAVCANARVGAACHGGTGGRALIAEQTTGPFVTEDDRCPRRPEMEFHVWQLHARLCCR